MINLNICITGATGFLGSRVLEMLVESNAHIFIIVRKLNPDSSIRRLIEQERITALECDLIDANSIARYSVLLSKCDVLVNIAGYMPETKKPFDDLFASIDVNIKGVINLLNYLRNLKKIIQISTTDVYGTDVTNPVSESNPTSPQTYYAVSKLSTEKYLEVYSKKNYILLTILRICIMYGPGEWHDRFIPNCMRSVMKNENIEIYGDGKDTRNYLFVDDAAKAALLAIEKDYEGIFNIASEKPYTKKEVAEKIIRLSGKDLKLISVHPEYKSKILTFDISKAKKILSFSPCTDLSTGLSKEMEWYHNERDEK